MQHASTVSTRNSSAAARILLAAGIAAGPVYVLVGLVEAFTRSGFDLARHSLSLLTNGDRGWIHMAMLVTTGLLTMAGAVGLRQSLTGGPGRSWGPILVGIYGAGLVAAGLLTADPAQGFPPGTPAGPTRDHQLARPGPPARRRHRLPVPDRRMRRLRAPLRVPGRARLGRILTGHRGGVPGRLRRDRLGEPGRLAQPGLRGGGRDRLGVGLSALRAGRRPGQLRRLDMGTPHHHPAERQRRDRHPGPRPNRLGPWVG